MRYFATFRPNCTLKNRVMVFTDLSRQDVWEFLALNYELAFDKVYTEPEMAKRLRHLYLATGNWVKPFAKCNLYTKDGIIQYPKEYSDFIEVKDKSESKPKDKDTSTTTIAKVDP